MVKKVRANVEVLLPHVQAGRKIVVPAPTCSYTMRKEWPLYVDSPDVRAVSAATMDLMQFLDGLRREKKLKLILAQNPDWADLSLEWQESLGWNLVPEAQSRLKRKARRG